MTLGRFYIWERCEGEFTGGRLGLTTQPVPPCDPVRPGGSGLSGRFVRVCNGGRIGGSDGEPGSLSVPIGNATPNVGGDLIFGPEFGGGRLDKRNRFAPKDRARFVEASHFGEVNAFYHLTLIAERIAGLLRRLGERPLPYAHARVNAHVLASPNTHWREIVCDEDGRKWRPVRGAEFGYYETPYPVGGTDEERAPTGEILLGHGTWSTKFGWLPRLAGAAYSCNASHIASHIYRAYGRHVSRHTADFQANALRTPHRQSNAKSATEMAVCAYWAATMLGTPHIECWHRRHDEQFIHPTSLARGRATMDRHGSVGDGARRRKSRLAAALWDLRQALLPDGGDVCDLLVLAALLEVGRLTDHPYRPRVRETRRLRQGDDILVAALVHADASRFDGEHSATIRDVMARWGLEPSVETIRRVARPMVPALPARMTGSAEVRRRVERVRARDPEAIIPSDEEMIPVDELENRLRATRHEPYDVVAVGDVMTGGRMRRRLGDHGPDYPFAWVKPVFRRASIVLANQEAPFARVAERDETTRTFSYRVDPKTAPVLRRAGINVMTVANNHLMDCGRDGVRETLHTLARQGIAVVGGGLDETTAHDPAIFGAGARRIGFLGYYWNSRTAAGVGLPGSARDLPDLVRSDIENLKRRVDRVVVTVHWGVPYERQPSAEDRVKARHFIDCGADIVIGHHPHIIQPMEIYRGRPIFFSIGNFAFGSGNSRAESIILGVGFSDEGIDVDVFPAYVRNRDPRLDYQPKLMRGDAARRTLNRLVSISGDHGSGLVIDDFSARLRVGPTDGGRVRAQAGKHR